MTTLLLPIWTAIWNLHCNRLLNTPRFTKTNPASFTSRAIVSVCSEPALHLMTHCGFSQSIHNASFAHSPVYVLAYSPIHPLIHSLNRTRVSMFAFLRVKFMWNTQIIHLANCLWLFRCHFELVAKFRFQFWHFWQRDKNNKQFSEFNWDRYFSTEMEKRLTAFLF